VRGPEGHGAFRDNPAPCLLASVLRSLKTVGVDEHLGRNIDLNLTFIDENGQSVALKDFFHKGRPVILDLVYYACPQLCNLILNGQTAAMKEIRGLPEINMRS